MREQLERILASPGFQTASRRARLLRFLVGQALEDRADSLKETVIATEVFERAPDYDPRVDSVVRVEVGRLRARLLEYYSEAGAGEPVRIEIPKGGYRPVFTFAGAASGAQPAEVKSLRRSRLRSWKTIAACVALAAIAVGVWRARGPAAANPASIAVLPFLNLSGDPANEYLCDGISEEVTEALAESSDLRVVSRTSAFQYKGRSADAREVGRRLGAGAVLEGSVALRGGEYRVVAQLIQASNGYHLWSESFNAGMAELPWVEGEIGRAVDRRLNPPRKGGAPRPLTREMPASGNAEAHDLYLRAAYELNLRTADSTRRALDLAAQAVEKDPAYAQPFVLMAAAESQLSTLLVETPRAAADRARLDIAKALALDPGNKGAHAQQAMLAYTSQWDWPRAEGEFQAALAGGSNGSAENLYGWCLMTRGRFEESRKHLQIAAGLDPLSLGPQLNQIEEFFAERRYAEARAKAAQVLRIAPANFVALGLVSAIAFWQRDCTSADAADRKLLEEYPQSPYAHLSALGGDAVCGRAAGIDAKLDAILHRDPPGFVSPYSLAAVYALRGDAKRADEYLERSAALREPVLLMLKEDRAFDGVRADSRIAALERRMGF